MLPLKAQQNQNGNDDNRIEVIPQREPYDQASGCSPSVDDLMTTDTPLDIGGEQQDPSHQQRHDLSPQDEDAPLPISQPELSPKKSHPWTRKWRHLTIGLPDILCDPCMQTRKEKFPENGKEMMLPQVMGKHKWPPSN